MRTTAFFAIAIVLAPSAVGASPSAAPAPAPSPSTAAEAASTPSGGTARVARAVAPSKLPLATASAPRIDGPAPEPAVGTLGAVTVKNRNTRARGSVRLYDDRGVLDRGAARAFMRIAGSTSAEPDDASDDDERLDLRLVQLAIRASYHFGGASMLIISATRSGTHGKHGTGEALDFSLDGVKASVLAAYLRTTPRAGVGIYTHPKTQYVHLDVREHSYHWLDGSPPGVTWREQLLRDPKQASRDAAWSPALDLPERPRR